MPDPVRLTTVAQVQQVLQFGALTQQQTDLINSLIAGVTGSFERELDRWIEAKERSEYFDVEAGRSWWSLRGYPVTAVGTVEFDHTAKWAGSQVALDTDLWRMVLADAEEHLLYVESPGAIGPRAMRVRYTGGLGATTADVVTAFPDLAMAAALEVANLYQRRTTLSIQAVGVVGADSQTLVALNWLPLTREVVARMKRW